MAYKVLDNRSQFGREAQICVDVVDGIVHPGDESDPGKEVYIEHVFYNFRLNA